MTRPDPLRLGAPRAVVVVATPTEAEGLADLAADGAEVIVSGIGPVNAALSAFEAAARLRPALLVSAGIGGAYPSSGLAPGDVAVSDALVYAGLGAWDGARFLDLGALGFEVAPGVFNALPAWDGARPFAARRGLACGSLATLESVTGDAARARQIEALFPGVLTEGMEGAGVAHAGLRLGVPTVEVRGVSNMVGPRDRASWRVAQAVRAYREVLRALLTDLADAR